MTLRPKTAADLALAPVAAEIDLNLQRLRQLASVDDLYADLALELNLGHRGETRDARAQEILRIALGDLDLHGWLAEVTDDSSRIHLHGGSVTLDIGLSAVIREYIAG